MSKTQRVTLETKARYLNSKKDIFLENRNGHFVRESFHEIDRMTRMDLMDQNLCPGKKDIFLGNMILVFIIYQL